MLCAVMRLFIGDLDHGACGRCPRGFMCYKGYLNGFAQSNTIWSWGKNFENDFLGKFWENSILRFKQEKNRSKNKNFEKKIITLKICFMICIW